ncbi:toxin regulator [Mesobacillus maritimus]|uniref:Toxin regulator n=1 Tax=Mesobacillus maritimus TaxID=1643336 RepID=A0ABS7K4S5_9BACI|nr:toxin regulator [Mesobacillus maritimus]MBY0097267.1 toxin regulator [Mesobacillus maritimus]
MKRILSFAKKNWRYTLVALLALWIGSTVGPSQAAMDTAIKVNKGMTEEIDELESLNSESATKIAELEAKVKEAEPFFKLKEEERKQKEAEAKAAEEKRLAEEKEKEEAEQKAAEAKAAEEKRLAEEKEKKGYETGITYDQLARTPDDYIAEKVKFKGKVVQVMEGDGTTQIRLAVNDNYDTVLFGEFDSSILDSRVLEDDVITIMGVSAGLITYESTMGGEISIPGVSIEKIEQ